MMTEVPPRDSGPMMLRMLVGDVDKPVADPISA
jgi:hypothetical protein